MMVGNVLTLSQEAAVETQSGTISTTDANNSSFAISMSAPPVKLHWDIQAWIFLHKTIGESSFCVISCTQKFETIFERPAIFIAWETRNKNIYLQQNAGRHQDDESGRMEHFWNRPEGVDAQCWLGNKSRGLFLYSFVTDIPLLIFLFVFVMYCTIFDFFIAALVRLRPI